MRLSVLIFLAYWEKKALIQRKMCSCSYFFQNKAPAVLILGIVLMKKTEFSNVGSNNFTALRNFIQKATRFYLLLFFWRHINKLQHIE